MTIHSYIYRNVNTGERINIICNNDGDKAREKYVLLSDSDNNLIYPEGFYFYIRELLTPPNYVGGMI